MMSMNLAMSAQVVGGPRIAETRVIEVGAYDLVKVTLAPPVPPATATEATAEIQPGDAGDIEALLIRASQYKAGITYKVSDGSTDTAALTLEQPHLYTRGMIALFGVDPQALKLKNTLASAVDVEVFVGRKAT
jgi:hypothetical protein